MKGIIFTLIILISGCSNKDDAYYINNTVLYDLGSLTDVALYLYTNPPTDIEITRKVEAMIYSKLFIVRNTEINLSQLQGEPIKGLCKAVLLSDNKNFGVSINEADVTTMIKSYLSQIRPKLKAIADDRKRTVFNDSDCAI